MSNVLLTVIYTFLKTIISTFLGPVFQAIDGLLISLNLTSYINLFNSVLYTYVGPAVGFFFEFMGPLTIGVLVLEFTVYVAYYAITMATTWILKVLNLIKKLPLA